MALANGPLRCTVLVPTLQSGGDQLSFSRQIEHGFVLHQHEMAVSGVDSQSSVGAVQFVLPAASLALTYK